MKVEVFMIVILSFSSPGERWPVVLVWLGIAQKACILSNQARRHPLDPMKPERETWWTRGVDSPGGLPEAVVVRAVQALRDLQIGECTAADAPLEELRHDEGYHPAAGTPERSYRHRVLTSSDGGGRAGEFWMRMG